MAPSQEEIERYERAKRGYYKNPAPAEAAHELLFTLRYTDHWQRKESAVNLAYYFSRIAQVTPAVIPLYEALLLEFSDEPRQLFVKVLLAANQKGGMPSPLDEEPRDPSHLDWCWIEFLVTGDLAPVRHIAKVLDLKDHLREQLEAWYATKVMPTPGLFQRIFSSKPTQILKTLADIGIEFDPQTGHIKGDEDIDYHCFRLAENKIKVFPMLPIQPTDDGMRAFALKGAAVWSMRSNAQQHEVVAACCREESQRPGGAARRRINP